MSGWGQGRRIVSIGECMVELARGPDGRFGLAYGGDTFNTAVYLARAGARVAYATALGDDPYSAGILTLAADEGIDTDLIATLPGRNAGLYLIETSASGERSFWYWRERAPARELMEGGSGRAIAAACLEASHVYLSAVTLSLLSPPQHDRLAAALAAARAAGARITMDGNYRPRGWGGDRDRARAVTERFWRITDTALPTFEDEAALWGDQNAEQTMARLGRLGVGEIVVKLGAEGALAALGGAPSRLIPCPAAIVPVDTTAAGDSFNAAFLTRRNSGAGLEEAVLAGHRLAGLVIRHRGAIVARSAMPAGSW
jgi:2-dehydro-3-deoxygluconokinase